MKTDPVGEDPGDCEETGAPTAEQVACTIAVHCSRLKQRGELSEAGRVEWRSEIERLLRDSTDDDRDHALARFDRMTLAPEVPSTFEEAWAEKVAEGYQYGEDALEQVRFGWEIREAVQRRREDSDG